MQQAFLNTPLIYWLLKIHNNIAYDFTKINYNLMYKTLYTGTSCPFSTVSDPLTYLSNLINWIWNQNICYHILIIDIKKITFVSCFWRKCSLGFQAFTHAVLIGTLWNLRYTLCICVKLLECIYFWWKVRYTYDMTHNVCVCDI